MNRDASVLHSSLPAQSGDEGPSLAERLRLLLAVPIEALLPGPAAMLEWPFDLMPFQREGVLALLRNDRLLLADDMGLGKTIQTIAALRILIVQRKIASALVVVPAAVIDQWRRELYRWASELQLIDVRGAPEERAWRWSASKHVYLVSYEALRADGASGRESSPMRRTWDVVVLDEAQKIKNRDTEVSHVVKQLRRKRSWVLTGTPLENKLDDLASILEFVDHDDSGARRMFTPGPALIARHRELQLRRRKLDVLPELPPKQIFPISLPLGQRQQESYDRAEQEGIVQLRAMGPAIRIVHVLELITRLKQICNLDPVSGQSAKIEDIHARLEVLAEEGHRALVFSQYTDDTFGVGALARELSDFRPLTYTGGMSGSERDQVVQRFKSNDSHKALILSLRAGGLGLNLQDASYVFHLDRWWNPAVERQAEDRTHRMGQLMPVTVFKYTCEGTIEERIEQLLIQKQQLFDEVVDDVSMDVSTRLTANEMFGLFGLPAPIASGVSGRTVAPSGLELEDRCAAILSARGWSVEHTPRSHDGGIDLVAHKIDEVGFERTLYVQCKDHARPVGVEVIRELLGVVPVGDMVQPVLAALEGVTAEAAALARQRKVQIWDRAALSRLESTG